MSYVILALAFGGLCGCYDIARRMDHRTRHGIRASIIVIGIACVVAMLNEHDIALGLMLAGIGLYRLSDRRMHADLKDGRRT